MLRAMSAALGLGLGLLSAPPVFAWGDNGFSEDKFPYTIDKSGIYGGSTVNSSCRIADKRTAILIYEAISVKVEKNQDGKCIIVAGEWRDYYTGSVLTDIKTVDYDYIVPLKEVWDSGANKWSADKRNEFASNHYWIVTTHTKIKHDKDGEGIGEWLPDSDYHACNYINGYVLAKIGNKLSFTEDEVDEIEDYHGEEVETDNGSESTCKISSVYQEGLIFESERELEVRD